MKFLCAALSLLTSAQVSCLARSLAGLLFDGLRFRRRLIVQNIATALPEMSPAERITTGRLSVMNFILTILEFLRSVRHDIAAATDMVGVEHVHAALAQKQGAYIICCHLGNWEAMGARITRSIAPANVLVKRVGGAGTDRFVTELRRRNGFLPVRRKHKGDGFRAIVTALDRHEIVGFVMDQARPGEPRLPFFGRLAKTNTSLAAIWLRRPAPIVPAFARRTGVGQHTIEFFPALNITPTTDQNADILRFSAIFNQAVEDMIKRNPTQYFWLHNRWK